MKKIIIIDYGCGNLLNLSRAIEFIGQRAEVTRDKDKIKLEKKNNNKPQEDMGFFIICYYNNSNKH